MSNRFTSRLLCLVLAIVTASAVLAGCGQRGPLYLPDDSKNQKDHSR